VYVAGAGPVGLACAAACQLLGAAVVIVGDMIPERLAQARSFGCETIDLRERVPLGDRIAQTVAVPEVDSAVDCVGFEAKGQAEQAGTEQPAAVLNSLMTVARAGGAIGIPGLLCYGRSRSQGRQREAGRVGSADRSGLGKIPQLRYRSMSRAPFQPSTHDGHPAQQGGCREGGECHGAALGGCAAEKFVLDPHGMVRSRRAAAELVEVGS
jgi:glutathione-independent formaldehyde dehydrogenase